MGKRKQTNIKGDKRLLSNEILVIAITPPSHMLLYKQVTQHAIVQHHVLINPYQFDISQSACLNQNTSTRQQVAN